MANNANISEKVSPDQWKGAFERGHQGREFTWGRYYAPDQYQEFKSLLERDQAAFTTLNGRYDRYREGRCIDCGAGLSIGDIAVLVPNGNPGGGRNTITLIEQYRDHNC